MAGKVLRNRICMVLTGRKIGMSQIFTEDGLAVPVTMVKVYKSYIISNDKAKGVTKIGIDVGQKSNKSIVGQLKGVKDINISKIYDVKLTDNPDNNSFDIDNIAKGDRILIKSVSKGKGFAGTVKRHSFSRGPKTHGSNNYRQPGSIGAQQPQRVVLGKKMAGRMGGDNMTVHNLTVADIDKDNQLVYIRGSVPGANKTLIRIQKESNA